MTILGRIESRRAQRFRLKASVVYEWADGAGATCCAEGIVRDISVSGVFVESSREIPAVGTRIQLEVHLPKLASEGTGMRLHGEGSTLRVHPSVHLRGGHQRGFAASLQFYPEASEDVLNGLKLSDTHQ